MEKELIFHILGLEETKDEEKISDAYRTALKSVNPEDDPEGFKRLRQAYEEGIAFARKKENEGEVKEKNEVDLWIDRVEAFYLDVRGEEIGMIEQMHLMELFEEKLAPIIYNRALDDAKLWFGQMMENMDSDYYTLYKNEE